MTKSEWHDFKVGDKVSKIVEDKEGKSVHLCTVVLIPENDPDDEIVVVRGGGELWYITPETCHLWKKGWA